MRLGRFKPLTSAADRLAARSCSYSRVLDSVVAHFDQFEFGNTSGGNQCCGMCSVVVRLVLRGTQGVRVAIAGTSNKSIPLPSVASRYSCYL